MWMRIFQLLSPASSLSRNEDSTMPTLSAPVRCLSGAFVVAAILVCGTTARAQTTLRWKFQPGQVLEQTIKQDMKSTVTARGQSFPNTATQVIDAIWSVGKVDSQGVAQVTQEVKRIRMTVGGAQTAEFDSASTAEPQGRMAAMAPAIKAFAKAKFEMQMNPLGQILAVQLSQDTLEGLKALSNTPGISGLFNQETLVNMTKQGAPAMP